jgi:hypothetical protein
MASLAAPSAAPDENDTSQRGYFTGAFLDTLVDPAVDRNADHELSLREIVEEVTTRVSRRSGGRQTPWLVRSESVGDFNVFSAAAKVESSAALSMASPEEEADEKETEAAVFEGFLSQKERLIFTRRLPERTRACIDASPEVEKLAEQCETISDGYRRLEASEKSRQEQGCGAGTEASYVCEALAEGRVSSDALYDFRRQAEDLCRDEYKRLAYEVAAPRCVAGTSK